MKEFAGNIKVDVDKLAFGILKLIHEDPDGACMQLGMFPATVMNAFESQLKAKIPDLFHTGDVEPVNGKQVRAEITRAVCSKVLALASEEGFLLV